MRILLLLIASAGLLHGQALGWTPLGNNTILTTAAAAGGLTGALVDCPTPSRPYCSGNAASYPFLGSVRSVIQAQSGCATDAVHNLMICTGGGHTDYVGNQIYVVDIAGQTITRVTDPTGPVNNLCSSNCPPYNAQVNPDGTSPSSHTQQGLIYMPNENAVYKWGIGIGYAAAVQTAGWWINMNTTSPTWVQKADLPTRFGDAGDNLIMDTSSASESILILS